MLLQELYNKVLGFFRQTDAEKESTKDVACNRLRVVLMQDRTNLTPELLERMRGELVELLSKYLEMDKEALELNLEQDGEQVALMLSIPVIRAKDEEEIKAALEAEEKVNSEAVNSEQSETEKTEDGHSEALAEESQETSDKEDETDESEEKPEDEPETKSEEEPKEEVKEEPKKEKPEKK